MQTHTAITRKVPKVHKDKLEIRDQEEIKEIEALQVIKVLLEILVLTVLMDQKGKQETLVAKA